MKKEQKQRYELKMRTGSAGYARRPEKSPKRKGDRMTNCAIICVCLLICVSVLKMSDSDMAKGVLGKLDYLISMQMDFEQTANAVVGYVTSTVSKLTGKDISVSTNITAFAMSPPVAGGKISQKFEDTTHPVFNTTVKPTGVQITADAASAYVYASCPGTVSNIVDNADGTKRVVVNYDKNTSVAYDNLGELYVKVNDKVEEKQILGLLPEVEQPVLKFEVWVNNEAKDPMQYIGTLEK